MTVRVERMFRPDLNTKASKRIIVGMAVPYGRRQEVSDDGRTRYLEEWAPRSLVRSTQPANAGRTSLLYTHLETPLNRLGRPLLLDDRPDGLYGEWRVDDSPIGDAVLQLVNDGKLAGLSVSARVSNTVRRAEVTVRVEGWLEHVALVEEPAYSEAMVTAVRATVAPGVTAAVWSSRLARLRGERDEALR